MRSGDLKVLLLIFVPMALGIIVSSPYFGYNFPIFLSGLFLAFWFWVGMLFADMSIGKGVSYFLGNSLTVISGLVYYWSFFIVSEEARNIYLAALSQFYAIPTAAISGQVWMVFNPGVVDNRFLLISYGLMFLVFTVGFIMKLRQISK
ncbi:hypothetical protein GGQ84_000934 [Desulfitispora alkaliphila]|uniref:hypothetical protein n=1 Tax=Desulfitispora alkaliphila TaxID=622674 RepID=UPI003D1E1A47